MHELSVARHILEAIRDLRDGQGNPPCRVIVQAGEFNHLSTPALCFAFDNSRPLYDLPDCELSVERIAPELTCDECGLKRPFQPETGFACPCGSSRVQITRGRELLIDRVEFPDPGDRPPLPPETSSTDNG